MEAEVLTEINIIIDRIITARKTVEYYRDILIPVHEEIVSLSQKEYNFMLSGVYMLLQEKQEEITIRHNCIEALRDYWIARSDFEKAFGGMFPEGDK